MTGNDAKVLQNDNMGSENGTMEHEIPSERDGSAIYTYKRSQSILWLSFHS